MNHEYKSLELYDPTLKDLFVNQVGVVGVLNQRHEFIPKHFAKTDCLDFSYKGKRIRIRKKKLIAIVWNGLERDSKVHLTFKDGDINNYHYSNIVEKKTLKG